MLSITSSLSVEIDPYRMNVQEAQLLANQVQLYYLDPTRLPLVVTFNREPHKFDYDALLRMGVPNKADSPKEDAPKPSE